MGRRRATKRKAPSSALVRVNTTTTGNSSANMEDLEAPSTSGIRQTRARARAVRRLTSSASTTTTSSSAVASSSNDSGDVHVSAVPITPPSTASAPVTMATSMAAGPSSVPGSVGGVNMAASIPRPVSDGSGPSHQQSNTGERIIQNVVSNVSLPVVNTTCSASGNGIGNIHVQEVDGARASNVQFNSLSHANTSSGINDSLHSIITCADSLLMGRPLSGLFTNVGNTGTGSCTVDSLASYRPIASSVIHQSQVPQISQPFQSSVPSMVGMTSQLNAVSAIGHSAPYQGLGVSASSIVSGLGAMSSSATNAGNIGSNLLTNPMFNDAPFQLSSVCEPLAANVSQSMKVKIINSEYVDFGQLLDFEERSTEEPRDMKLVVDENGTFIWKPNKPKKQITSIFGWTSAFLIFSSIFLQAHPHRAQELLKYAQIVRTAAARFGGFNSNRMGWYAYDKQWRLRQACHPQRSWGVLDNELWSMYVATPVQNRGYQQRFQQDQQGLGIQNFRPFNQRYRFQSKRGGFTTNTWRGNAMSQNLCFNFNKSECTRKNCPFKHKCAKCQDGSHGAEKCKKSV